MRGRQNGVPLGLSGNGFRSVWWQVTGTPATGASRVCRSAVTAAKAEAPHHLSFEGGGGLSVLCAIRDSNPEPAD